MFMPDSRERVLRFLKMFGRELVDNGWRYDLVVPLSTLRREESTLPHAPEPTHATPRVGRDRP